MNNIIRNLRWGKIIKHYCCLNYQTSSLSYSRTFQRTYQDNATANKKRREIFHTSVRLKSNYKEKVSRYVYSYGINIPISYKGKELKFAAHSLLNSIFQKVRYYSTSIFHYFKLTFSASGAPVVVFELHMQT